MIKSEIEKDTSNDQSRSKANQSIARFTSHERSDIHNDTKSIEAVQVKVKRN